MSKWEDLNKNISNCNNNDFSVTANELAKYGKELPKKNPLRNSIYQLLNLSCKTFQNASDLQKGHIKKLINYTLTYLTDIASGKIALAKIRMLKNSKALDSPRCPYWLKVLIGIVLLIIVVALLLSAIALAISLTGGGAAAFVAPAIILLKPVIDVIASVSIAGITSGAIGTPIATGILAGASALGGGIAGMFSFFMMNRPFTDLAEKIIKEKDQSITYV